MSVFEIDDSAAPLIVVGFPDDFSIEEYYGLFARYRSLCEVHPRIT